ncbi:MAG: hypothetical protein KGJ57_08275 [Sphingomonadales bacterium]|nr:hypothetical protein [Sphingomonadales bacterium]MDE2169410.1 hypothetical protein [Sphingomonadales bacterium]
MTPFLRHIAFLLLLALSSLYALARGGRPEQIGAATLLGGAMLTVWIAPPLPLRFHRVETGILAIDLILFGMFLWLSVRTTRFWPLWIAALLGAEVLVHIGLMIAPTIIPQAYGDTLALWSWAAQMALIAATWRHRVRLTRTGADRPWKM